MIHRKILTITLAVLALALAASPALATAAHRSVHHKAPHRYSPRHGGKCRKAYKRVVKHKRHHHKKVFCVRRVTKKHRKAGPKKATPPAPTTPAPAPTEKTKLHAHLDPTYTRNPLDPFEVTYAYSASATQEVQGLVAQETAPLPSGVLALYSDGRLECAVNVGSGIEGSECPVEYEALGQHSVTTIYSSGEQSATETEIEDIEPLPTSVELSAKYEALGTPQPVTGPNQPSGWSLVGHLDIDWSATPSPAVAGLGCEEPTAVLFGHLTPSGCYEVRGGTQNEPGHTSVNVYAQMLCTGKAARIRVDGSPPSDVIPEVGMPSAEELETGSVHLRAAVAHGLGTNAGYAESATTIPLIVRPTAAATC